MCKHIYIDRNETGYWGQEWREKRGMITKEHQKLPGVMDVLIILFVVMVSQVAAYVTTRQISRFKYVLFIVR